MSICLKPCPCGRVPDPENLTIEEGSNYRWAFVVCPCGEWQSEFRRTYPEDPEEDLRRAVRQWNNMPWHKSEEGGCCDTLSSGDR